MSVSNDDVYVDLLMSNPIQTKANERVQVQFNQSQSQAILPNTNGYKLAIIRFSLNTETLPIFIPTMQNTNTTVYSITMAYNGSHYQQFMQFVPQNLNPVDSDERYYVYSYQYLIYLVNQCFQQCYDGLKALQPTLDFSVPIMSIGSTQLCSITIDNTEYGYNETNKINTYMNYSMYALFSSLPAMLVSSTNGRDYQLNNLLSSNPALLTQDYSTVMLWNPVSSVVFTTNLLPIYQSQTPPIQIYKHGTIVNSNSTYNFLNILTDFIGDELNFTPYIQYSADIYRFLSLKHNTEIRNIDLQVFWNNKNTGEKKPLYLGVGGSCSVKILLTKNF